VVFILVLIDEPATSNGKIVNATSQEVQIVHAYSYEV
jgi:hypothetical protein